MATSGGRISQEMREWERIKILKRKQERNERIAQQKEINHIKFILGDLVYQKFQDELSQFMLVKNTEENKIIFRPVEIFLSVLASDRELMARLKEEVQIRLATEKD